MALISSLLLSGQVSVLTNRYDNGRTGLNPNETFLNPANVKSATFAKLGAYNVDGYVVAQPLYMQNVSIGGTSHNVVFVATMHDSLYAFDADNITGAPLWQVSFINPGAGITTVPMEDQGCKGVNGYNEMGIQGTPVIDPDRWHALRFRQNKRRDRAPITVMCTGCMQSMSRLATRNCIAQFRSAVRYRV